MVETTGYVFNKIVNKARPFYELPPVLTGSICNRIEKGSSQISTIWLKPFELCIFSHPDLLGSD